MCNTLSYWTNTFPFTLAISEDICSLGSVSAIPQDAWHPEFSCWLLISFAPPVLPPVSHVWRLTSVLETKFQPELDKVKMKWRRVLSHKSKFTSVNNWAININPFSYTSAHACVFGCAKNHCWALVLIPCWDTELWRCGDFANVLLTAAWEPQDQQAPGRCSAPGPCLCFPQDLSCLCWLVALFPSLREIPVFYGTRLQSEGCRVFVLWNAAGILESRWKLLTSPKIQSSCSCYWKTFC